MASGVNTGFKAIGDALGSAWGRLSGNAGPSLNANATRAMTRGEAEAAAREAARETRQESRTGLFLRPAADKGTLQAAAKEALTDSGLSRGEINGIAARAAKREEHGGAFERITMGTAAWSGRHPFLATGAAAATIGASGVFNVASAVKDFIGGLIPDNIENTVQALTGGVGSLVSGAGNFGFETLGSVFNTATEGLEHIGMDPTWAKGVVGLGTFFALKSALGMITEATGINKYAPIIGGLGVILAAGIIALKIAGAADDAEPVANREPAATAGVTAPAPAFVPS